MTKPDSGLSYRSWFADECVVWLNACLDRIDAEILAHQLAELERKVFRRDAGFRHAHLLGLPDELAPAVAVLIYSPSRDARRRAAGIIQRVLQATAAAA